MNNRRLAALTALVLAVSSCGDDEPAGPAQFTDEDSRIEVVVGDEFQIILDSNATTGFSWDFETPADGAVLRLIGERYEPDESDLIGSGGQQEFDFIAVGEGSTLIHLWYIRGFDDPPEPTDQAQFEVIVGAAVPDETVASTVPDEPGDTTPDDEDPITLVELIARGDATDVMVRTLLFDDGTGLVMCRALAESMPPQCPGDKVPVANPDDIDIQFSQLGGVSWTDEVVTLTGTLSDGIFTVEN